MSASATSSSPRTPIEQLRLVLEGSPRPLAAPRRLGPVLLVLAAVVAIWVTTGVSAGDSALFLAYHLIYVVLPGWIVYRLLRPDDPVRVRQLVIGWAIGYVLEVMMFALTAAVRDRALLAFYPIAVLGIGASAWRMRMQGRARPQGQAVALPAGWDWAVSGLCLLALAFVGVEFFGSTPLPGQVSRVSYGIDTVWYLSLAGEALHHWPVADPTVSGQPLFYHLFSTFDAAAITQVTGIGLPTVFFRLCTVPMVLLTVLGLALAGSTFGGGWTGPIAVALALFVGELNIDPHVGYKFANEMGDDVLAISPSFLMGAALFAPLLGLVCELARQAPSRWVRSRRRLSGGSQLPYGVLAAFGLLAIGATGAKATTAPVLAGGLALYLLWRCIKHRELHFPLLAALGITLVVFGFFYLISYGGAGADQLALDPPGAVRQMEVTGFFASLLGFHGTLKAAMWIALTAVGVVGAYGAQLVGVIAATARPALRSVSSRDGAAGVLLAIFLAGEVPYLLYTHPGMSQVFFAECGMLAACLVSAEGLRSLWVRADATRRLSAVAAGAAGLTLVVALLLPTLLTHPGQSWHSLCLDIDMGLAVSLTVAYAGAIIRRRGRIARRWAYVAAVVAAVGVTGRMLTVAAPTVDQLAHGRPLYSQTGAGMTSGLYRALNWIRQHSPPSSVIAVNNFRDWSLYWSDGWAVPDDFNYSAFAERPVFIEGWIYTQAAMTASNAVYYGRQMLFPGRLALNNAIFQWAHPTALQIAARRYGVRYLLADLVHNGVNPRLANIARLVFADRDARVYAVPRQDFETEVLAERIPRAVSR